MEEVKVILSNKTNEVCNDSGVCVKVNEILLSPNDGNTYLHEFNLPESIKKRLIYFLENKEMLDDEIIKDSGDFVSYLLEFPLKDTGALARLQVDYSKNIVPGTVVLIQNNNKEWKYREHHYAVYLGGGKYISKLLDKDVSISSLQDMMNLHGFSDVTYLKKD